MGLVKITFDDSTVTSKQDADINYHLGNLVPAGIIKGLGDECAAYISNSNIIFKSGYVQIYGRRIYVEAQTSIAITTDSTKYGYVIITVNLSTNAAILTKVESSSSTISLTQQDLSKSGTIYQMPLIKYKKTSSSVSFESSFTPTYIEPAMPVAQQALTKANSLKLKRTTINKSTYNSAEYEYYSNVTFDYSSLPDNSLLVFKFYSSDIEGYGSLTNVCGTFVCHKYDFSYNANKTAIRNNDNTDWIKVTLSGLGDTITITWNTTTKLWNAITLEIYTVE